MHHFSLISITMEPHWDLYDLLIFGEAVHEGCFKITFYYISNLEKKLS